MVNPSQQRPHRAPRALTDAQRQAARDASRRYRARLRRARSPTAELDPLEVAAAAEVRRLANVEAARRYRARLRVIAVRASARLRVIAVRATATWWDRHQLEHSFAVRDPTDPAHTRLIGAWRGTCGVRAAPHDPASACKAFLLDSEPVGTCCKVGKKTLPPLQDLPAFLSALSTRRGFGAASLQLNNIFHLAVQGYSREDGRVPFTGAPAFAIRGNIYHRILPYDCAAPLNMYAFDNGLLDREVPPSVVSRPEMHRIREELTAMNRLCETSAHLIEHTAQRMAAEHRLEA